MRPIHVLVAFGTRPEAVKLAPVVTALAAAEEFQVTCLLTAQHREMVDQVVEAFGLPIHHDLDLMRPRQTLAELTSRVIAAVSPVIEASQPDLVLVQGDTTTVMATALAAFYEQVPVGHVEAGLRTSERYDPFPEEMNRRLTGRLATLHFAPTAWAAENLRRENVPAEDVYVTGNTVIDALRQVSANDLPLPADLPAEALAGRRLVLLTAHRRENLGQPLESICAGVADLVAAEPEVVVVYPMHRNPAVRETVQARLGDLPRVHLIEPPEYFTFVGLMRRSELILTDSGGIQEEGPALGKPVLVLRRTTERPEGVDAGTARLIGTARADLLAAARELLGDPAAYQQMARAVNPYGDGQASARILAVIQHVLRSGPRPADFQP